MTDAPLDTKGKRPTFFDDPAIDSMMTALLEVMSENWALKERLYALERVLQDTGTITDKAVENVVWDDDDRARHEAERQRLLNDAFRALKADFQSLPTRQNELD